MKIYLQHPLAKLIPPQSQAESIAQEESMKEIGLKDEITLFEGMIFDGWHRYNKCLKLGIAPRFKDFHSNGVTPIAFLTACVAGRHLNSTQKACMAVGFQRPMAEAFKNCLKTKKTKHVPPQNHEGGTSRERVAKIFGVSSSIVGHALTVFNRDKKLFDQCFKGEITINAAMEMVKERVKPTKAVVTPREMSGTPLPALPDLFTAGYETLETFIKEMNQSGLELTLEAFEGRFYGQFHKRGEKREWKATDGQLKLRASIVTAGREALK